jgi:hypothetical protein
MGLGLDSSGTASAWQVKGPKFKLQKLQKKKRKL